MDWNDKEAVGNGACSEQADRNRDTKGKEIYVSGSAQRDCDPEFL